MSKSFEVIFREFADSETFVLSRGLLEDYKRQAAQDERERIIKLLEDQQIRFISNGFWTEGVAVRASVALIKGENK